MDDPKYDVLVRALDKLREEAPASFKSYRPCVSDGEDISKARSLAFIHLFLAVKFGLSDFYDRHAYITDGSQDGGIDAYYVDPDLKKIYLIQSKFRTSAARFENKSTDARDLIKVEMARVIKGEETDSRGNEFNSKIKGLQSALQEIRDIARYDYVVCFLGNVYHYTDEQIRRAIDNSNYDIYDASRAYTELLFPLTTGTYFDPDDIVISIQLSDKEHPRLKQSVETDYGDYNVTAIFVPAAEVGRILVRSSPKTDR